MPTDHISYIPLASSVDSILDSLNATTTSPRARRTARNLHFQSQSLQAIGSILSTNFTRTDWALGQQATITIPLLVRKLHERSSIPDVLITACLDECRQLAVDLKAVAEGRPR